MPLRVRQPEPCTHSNCLERQPVVVACSDVICEFPLKEMLAFHKQKGAEGTILVTRVRSSTEHQTILSHFILYCTHVALSSTSDNTLAAVPVNLILEYTVHSMPESFCASFAVWQICLLILE